ncbi:MAG: DUF3137 domain-containing protein [Crocinitomicaceae bacterium]|nr:DUF3137 domain-containing protein [Crocinitomicaceae bacterium]
MQRVLGTQFHGEMTSSERIQQVYEETRQDLDSIYRKQRVTGILQKLMWLILGLYFVAVILFMFSYFLKVDFGALSKYVNPIGDNPENPYQHLYPLAGLLILQFISSSVFTYLFRKFKELEAATFVKMTKGLFPQSEFTQISQLDTNHVRESHLFPWIKKGTHAHTFGQMRSKVNRTNVQVADIGFTERTTENKVINFLLNIPFLNMFVMLYQYVSKNIFGSKSAENMYYTFRGLYGWTSFNKSLKGRTVIVPTTFTSKTDRIASFKFKQEEKVQLEDARFSEHYVAYGTDQAETKRILSSKMMEKMLELRERFGRDIMLSFKNNKLFVAIKNPNGLFSFPAGRLDSIQILEEIVGDVDTIESIVEEFDSNWKISVQ